MPVCDARPMVEPADASPLGVPPDVTGGTVDARTRIGRSIATLRAAGTNRAIARAVVAFGGFNLSEWAIWIAMLVYAYERGGATAAGLVAVVQLLPSAILSPVIAGYGDRLPRERLLLASYVVQAVGMTVTAYALASEAEPIVVYLLAAATTVGIGMTRPAHFSVLPSLARTPDELTAANVASSTVQNLAILVAPAMAGLILAASGAGAVFALAAVVSTGSALLVALIRTEPLARAAADQPLAVGAAVEGGGVATEIELAPPDVDHEPVIGLIDGLRILRRHVGTRTIVILIGTGSLIEGSLDVIGVVLALELLQTGESGVGILGSAVGLGGLVGAAIAATLVGRRRLAGPFAIGLILWGGPLAIVGLLPLPLLAVLLFVVAGVGRSLMDVAGRTLLQRVAPHDVLAGVLGSLEGLQDLMLAAGSIAVPILIALVGPRWAIVLAGLWLPIVVLLTWRYVVAADAHAVIHVRELDRLRALPLFAPLPPPTIEWLAAALQTIPVPAGTAVIREGQAGDRFYVIDAGSCEVTIGERVIRTLGPGDGFGEIALLRAGAADGVRVDPRADVVDGARARRLHPGGHGSRRLAPGRRRPRRAAPGRGHRRGRLRRRPLSSGACSTRRRSSTSSGTRRSSG